MEERDNNQIKVTVIVPVRDMARTLSACVRSILAQTHSNLEVIIADDASGDDSLRVAKRLEASEPRVTLLENEMHQGLYRTRISAISQASGDYVTFADADDTMEPEAVQRMLAMGIDLGVDLVQMRFRRRIKGLSLKYLEVWEPTLAGRRIEGLDFRSLASFIGMDSYIYPAAWGKLYRRDLLQSMRPIDYREFWGEDQIFNIQYLRTARSLALLDYVGYNYRWGGGTCRYKFSMLRDYKHVHTLKRVLGQSEEYINAELIQQLRYHVRQLVTEMGWTPVATEKVLREELNDPIWKQVGFSLSAAELVEQESESIRRSPMKYLVKKLIR